MRRLCLILALLAATAGCWLSGVGIHPRKGSGSQSVHAEFPSGGNQGAFTPADGFGYDNGRSLDQRR